DAAGTLARDLLSRVHGRLGNAWREALIRARRGGEALTKNQARARIDESNSRPGVLAERLIDLPRHQVADVLRDAAATAATLEAR
ncbi:MAG TPA: putative methyltransferase, partial [Thermopolyspora sp.]